jgi:hypothetical protein
MASLSNPTTNKGAIYLVQWRVDTGGYNPNQLAAYVIDSDGTMEKDVVISHAIKSISDCLTIGKDRKEAALKDYDFCDVRGPYAPFRVEGGMLWTQESVANYLKNNEPHVFKKVKHMVVVASALDG